MDYRVPHELASVLSDYQKYRVISKSPSFITFDSSIKVFQKGNYGWQEIDLFSAKNSHDQLVVQHIDAIPKPENRGGGFFGGAVKRIADDYIKEQAGILAEATGQSFKSNTDGSEKTIENDGQDVFPIKGAAEQAGADMATDSGLSSAIKVAAAAATFKGVLKNPGKVFNNIDDVIKKAVKDTRSSSEALGKAGMEQAKNRLGLKTDAQFKDRYHGPDDLAKDKKGKLTEIEAKGNNKNSKAVAKDTKDNKQGSAAKNLNRAEKMAGKLKKVGVPSNRQGGAYTQAELDLWKQIEDTKGQKRHISTHTNTETGQVKVYERDPDGEIIKTLDEFKLDNFDAVKDGINEHFTNLQK